MKSKKSNHLRKLSFEHLEDRLNPSSFFSDFSADPGIETNNSERYSVSNGALETNSYTNSQEYGTLPVNYKGEDFTLQFDVKILERSTGDTNIGLFSDSRKTNQPSPGDPALYVFYGGYEQSLGIRGYDGNGAYFEGNGKAPSFDMNTVYHNTLVYNAETKDATLTVSSEEDADYQTPYVSTAVLAQGLAELSHLGVSSVGNWSSSGRFQAAEIDNLYFAPIDKNPIEPNDVNADGIVSPLDALVIINYLNAENPEEVSPPFLDVDGDKYVSPLDVSHVINYLNKDSLTEAEYSPHSQTYHYSQSLSPTLVDKVFEDFSFVKKGKKALRNY